jgi:conserved oligomeric Golgi complex subunit 2
MGGGQNTTAMSQSYFFLQDNSRVPLLDDSDGNQLATLYNNILQFVERNCVEVMEIAVRVTKKHGKGKIVANGTPARGSPVPDMAQGIGAGPGAGFEIMSNVVWAEIGRALMDELGALIFAAGKPAEFKSVSLGMVYEIFLVLTLCVNRTTQRPRLLYPVWSISPRICTL